MKYKIGDKVRVIKATSGCMGAEGSIGVVTDKKNTDGLLDYRDGFNIELKNGKIWRIGFESVCEPVEEELTAEEATSTSAALILGMCIIAQRLGKPVPAVYYTSTKVFK